MNLFKRLRARIIPVALRRGERGEEGVAIFAAVAVSTVFLMASASIALTVGNNITSSEQGVLGATATQSASAGLNAADVTVQSDIQNNSSLPCTYSGQIAQSQGAVPETYSVALTYYSSVNVAASPPTASGAITCVSGSVASPSGVAAVAMVSTGSAGATRTKWTQTLYALFTVSTGGFAGGYGIYDNSGIELQNSISATANTGMIYVNGPVQCNSATVNGPLYVNDPGNANATTVGNPSGYGFYMTNGCTITGALDVDGSTSVSTSSPKVDGNALVEGSVSFSNSGPQFAGNLTTSGTVSPASSSYVSGTITQNATVTLPTPATFPVETWNSSAWSSAGWTLDNYTGTCGSWQNSNQTPTGVYLEFSNDVASGLQTVLYTSCPLTFPQNMVAQLTANFAIVDTATGGMDFNAVTMESNSSVLRDLYLVVPADPTSPSTATVMSQATCGSNYEIQGSDQEAFGTSSNPVHTLIYDPCTVALTNAGVITGQMVAGSFGTSLTDELSFTYASAGTLPGTTGSGTGLTVVDQYVESSN
jgi:hypothetical protein